MELSKYIGKRIKEFRKARNLTSEELAEKLALPEQQLHVTKMV